MKYIWKEEKRGIELSNNSCQPQKNVKLLAELTNNIIITTSTFKRDNNNMGLSGNTGQPLLTLKNMVDFTAALQNKKKQSIIYFLIENDVCYQSGLRKVFPFFKNRGTVEHYLMALQSEGIIEEVPRENYAKVEEIKILNAHRRAFRIPDHHFDKKIIFYRLTPLAKEYYKRLKWDDILDENSKRIVNNYKKIIAEKKHKDVERKYRHQTIENNCETRANNFVSKLQEKFVETMGSEWEKYKEKWFELRGKIKQIYIAKMKNQDWEALAQKYPVAVRKLIIYCIEHEHISKEVFLEAVEDGEND